MADNGSDHDRIVGLEVSVQFMREEQQSSTKTILSRIDDLAEHLVSRCDLRHDDLDRRLFDSRAAKTAAGQRSLGKLGLVVSLICALLGGIGGATVNCVAQRNRSTATLSP